MQQILGAYYCFLPNYRVICRYACVIVITDHRGRVCWHDLSFQFDTNQITQLDSITDNVNLYLFSRDIEVTVKMEVRLKVHLSGVVTWVRVDCENSEPGSISDGIVCSVHYPPSYFQILPVLDLICVAVFVCDSPFHRFTAFSFALNLPVFTMNLCIYTYIC